MPSVSSKEYPRSLDLSAGILAGAVATVVTNPLAVISTRLQSSSFSFTKVCGITARLPWSIFAFERNISLNVCSDVAPYRSATFVSYAKGMIKNEGFSLFSRGLAANIAAISLSKGVYFTVYSSCKNFFGNKWGENYSGSTYIHIISSAFAGFTSCTLTNPVWFLKTRLQLDSRDKTCTKLLMISVAIYRHEGIRAFYRGLTASYLGIAETVIHFALYEYMLKMLRDRRTLPPRSMICEKFNISDYVLASVVSKTTATVLAYPHEVVRTRARERENTEKSFTRLVRTVLKKEGWQGFYGGLATHLVRQVPNTAILFLIYESVVYYGTQFLKVKNN